MSQLLLNASEPEEFRAALVVDGEVLAYRAQRASAANLVGNLYKGRVVNLEKGIGAAFVDVGVGRNAFLHASDCVGGGGGDDRIDAFVRLGDEVLVQVTRESIGGKGPVLTAQISLPGRFLVMLPFAEAGGVSRRIPAGAGDRKEMRKRVRELEERGGHALIMRTAGAQRTKRELERDLKILKRLWRGVEEAAARSDAPALLYEESDFVASALRDLVDASVDEIVVDTPEALARAQKMVAAVQPELAGRLRLETSTRPLFHGHGIEEQLDRLALRRVPLKGGGSVVFDTTEALVAVDVNSGRIRSDEGLEETALLTNLEAAAEIARQLRLRDLGGVVAVDFIDMREADHVRQVERAFKAALAADRARIRTGRLGPFGVFVLTRRRAGEGAHEPDRACPQCGGGGRVRRPEGIALRVFRELRARAVGRGRKALRARVSPAVAEILEGRHYGGLRAVSEETGRLIVIERDGTRPVDAWDVEAFAAP